MTNSCLLIQVQVTCWFLPHVLLLDRYWLSMFHKVMLRIYTHVRLDYNT